jgi:hypothetical protein
MGKAGVSIGAFVGSGSRVGVASTGFEVGSTGIASTVGSVVGAAVDADSIAGSAADSLETAVQPIIPNRIRQATSKRRFITKILLNWKTK